MKLYIRLIALSIIFFCVSCESMEDTYEKYWADGPIKYVGKCSDLKAEPGWHRFKLTWKNSIDATTDKIKIVWSSNAKKDSVILDKEEESYITEAVFEDESYTFNIYAVDKNNNHSLGTTTYSRPITHNHKLVREFVSVEERYAFIKNNLVLFMSDYDEKVVDPTINYTKVSGEIVEWVLTQEDIEKKYHVLKDVDVSKPVSITRTGKLEESFDDVVFKPYELNVDNIFINPDLALQVNNYYSLLELSDDFVKEAEEVHLNYSLNKMDALLHFPNLKKVVLGGERYMYAGYENDASSNLLLDSEATIFTLKTLHELLGVEVDIYNDQYGLLASLDFANDMGNPTIPAIDYLDNSNWEISCSTQEPYDNSHPEYLLDDDVNTTWRPIIESSKIREHIVTIDMKAKKTIKGFKIVQPISDDIVSAYFPDVFKIEVSTDGSDWNNALLRAQREIGTGRGETTIINLAGPKEVRYVRFILNDKISTRKCTYLSDFIIF